MLDKEIPGQNWNADLIYDIGSGFPMTGYSERIRCVCYTDNTRLDPTFRTSRDYPIKRGDCVYLPERSGGTFYLLVEEPQLMPDCYTTHATRCNAYITIKHTKTIPVDDYGYLIDANQDPEETLIRNLPAIVNHAQQINQAQHTPGLIVEDQISVTIQRNAYTAAIEPEAWFILDKTKYTILDTISDPGENGSGTITFLCKREAGSRIR